MSADEIDENVDGGPPAGVRARVEGDMRFWLDPRPEYLYVRWAGCVSTVATADVWLAAIDAALRKSGLFRVLWEARPAQVHPPEVRDHIWAWLERAEYLAVSSVMVNSEMLRVSVNLSRVASGVRLRAFDNRESAEGWLLRQRR
ncbi:MAG: hypothetical protein AB8I08_18060 [Sandaracinaceae bacterium]